MADEKIDVSEVLVVEAGSEAIAEPLFHYGSSDLSWDDLMNASKVSRPIPFLYLCLMIG